VPRFWASLSAGLRIQLNVILCFAVIKTYLRIWLCIHISLIHYLLKVHLKRQRYTLVFAFSSLFSVLHCSLHFFALQYYSTVKDVKNLSFDQSIDNGCRRRLNIVCCCFFHDLWSMINYSYSKKSCSPPWILFKLSSWLDVLLSTATVYFLLFIYFFWLFHRLVAV
jgi:hypothetical protein